MKNTLAWLSLAVLLGLLVNLAGISCAKKKEEQEQEKVEEQQEVVEKGLLSSSDSVLWRGYLESQPEDTCRAYLLLGVYYLANDLPDKAIPLLNRAVEYNPDRAVTFLNLGDAYNRKEDYKKATEAFRMYIQRAPGSVLSSEIYRIIEKYRSKETENQAP